MKPSTAPAAVVIPERHRKILRTVIELFVERAVPVGSRAVSRREGIDLSAATVRNVMADLEEIGLLAQPHLSAGRTPTTTALRFWVDHMVVPRVPSDSQKQVMHEAVVPSAAPRQTVESLAAVLSDLSGGAAVALKPLFDHGRLQRAEFVRVSDSRLMLLWVTQWGAVYHREITCDETIRSTAIEQLESLLNQEFHGATFDEVRASLSRDMRVMREEFAQLLQQLLLVDSISNDDVIVQGVSRVTGLPDFDSTEALRKLYEAFENKKVLASLLEEVTRHGGLKVVLNEDAVLDCAGLGLVAASYGIEGAGLGSIGIVGPTRMAYPEILGLVRFATGLIDETLTDTDS